MKKTTVLIAALFALAAPVTSFAAMDHNSMDDMDMSNAGEMQHGDMQHGASHGKMDDQCTKECEMLLKNCAQDVSNIQDQIKTLQTEVNEKGASPHTLKELKTLSNKLKDAKETLNALQKPGK
jgi:peptidoglycan hydrolase CwlO-like protein